MTHITVLSALTDAVDSVLNTVTEHAKPKKKEQDNNDTLTANNLGNYKKGKNLGIFKLTAYCPCYECNGKWSHGNTTTTSTGVVAKANHTIAADNRILKANTWVIINNKLYKVEDVGGAVKGKHIDIYVNKHSETTKFGTRYANVYLAEKK